MPNRRAITRLWRKFDELTRRVVQENYYKALLVELNVEHLRARGFRFPGFLNVLSRANAWIYKLNAWADNGLREQDALREREREASDKER